MNDKRSRIIAGMAAGMFWGVVVLWWGAGLFLHTKNRFEVADGLLLGLFPAGLITITMVGRLAQRRFFDDGLIDGDAFESGSGADVDQRVLTNTIEQIVLAICIWPFAGSILGPGVIVALGVSFAVARILFWIGYHLSPLMRAFGFAATFYPTVLAALWSLWRVAT